MRIIVETQGNKSRMIVVNKLLTNGHRDKLLVRTLSREIHTIFKNREKFI